ncbi:MAG: DNA methyltransferase [Chloroflexi bacterium]|nr:DNA methyltransferase [Chloroflexota bacterium]
MSAPPSPQSLEPWLDRVHHGDCLELMRCLPSRSIGLIVTSPPFNLSLSTGNGDRIRYDSWGDAMPHHEYVKWQRRCLTEMMRILRPDGAIYYHHKTRVQSGVEQDRIDILEGFPVRQTITWARDGGINHNPGYYLPTADFVYLIVPSRQAFRLSKEARGMGTVWRVRQDTRNRYPGSWPQEIPDRCIRGTAAEVVLDPFIGSGTTALAALQAGRRYIGMEISEYVCQLARRRIAASAKSSRQRILAYLATRQCADRQAIIADTGIALRTIMWHLGKLTQEGLIVATTDPRDGRRRRYRLDRGSHFDQKIGATPPPERGCVAPIFDPGSAPDPRTDTSASSTEALFERSSERDEPPGPGPGSNS